MLFSDAPSRNQLLTQLRLLNQTAYDQLEQEGYLSFSDEDLMPILEDEVSAELKKQALINKKLDDDLFRNIRKKTDDPIDTFERKKVKDNFRKTIESQNIRDAHKKTMDELITNKPILRPLAPELKPLKPYHQKMYEAENKELEDYLADHDGEFILDDNNGILGVNFPENEDLARQALDKTHYKLKIYVKQDATNEAISMHFLNKINSLDDIYEYLESSIFALPKPFKLTFDLSGVFEVHNGDKVTYEEREIKGFVHKYNLNPEIPVVVQFNQDLDVVKKYIESILHNYQVSESPTKLIYVTSVMFKVHKLRKTNGKIANLPIEFIKSKYVITDNEDDKLCWYRFLAVCLNPKLANTKTFNIRDRTAAAKELLCKEHGIEYLDNANRPTEAAKKLLSEFDGVTQEYMMECALNKYKININIYQYDLNTKIYDIQEQWHINQEDPFSALLFTNNKTIHIMYIKNPEALTRVMVCPKCRWFTLSKDWSHSNQRMEKHIAKCDGKFRKAFVAEKCSKPYCPHILGNPVYAYCLAYGLQFKPQQYHMTYDFETMEKLIGKECGSSTTVDSQLVPLSVSCCVKSARGVCVKHWDVRENEFIAKWIEWMFSQAIGVVEDKKMFYNEMGVDEKIVRDMNTVTVFGFNSARFDSNLFKEYLNMKGCKIDNASLIGTPSAMKQFILTNGKVQLRFLDAQAFVAGGTLKQFGKDFGGVDNDAKGTFPYEAINTENYLEVLNR